MKTRIFVLSLAHALCVGSVQAQVVADSACEKYAVDIAAFATCDSPTRVARADAEERPAVAPPADRKTPEKRSSKEQEEAPPPALKPVPRPQTLTPLRPQ